MDHEIQEHVISLLESYCEREKRIALLHYELKHPANINPNDMLTSMALGRSDGTPHGLGHISDKTLYIALNYQEQAEKLNSDTVDEIARQLMRLEHTQAQLKYCISLLEDHQQQVLRAVYVDRLKMKEIEKLLSRSTKTVRKLRGDALDALCRMYEFMAHKH